jgi:anti-sigma regulatory factor (Ser/Thr protein kinase)
VARLLVKQSAQPEAAWLTRRLVQTMTPELSAGERADLTLLVTELINNGVRHAAGRDGGFITVEVLVSEKRIRVDVRDGGNGFAKPQLPTPGEERANGWGLYLVDALADRWGMDRNQAAVWLEVCRT